MGNREIACYGVFKSLIWQTCKNQGLCGKHTVLKMDRKHSGKREIAR